MKAFHPPPLIGMVVTALQDMDLDYHSKAFPIFAYGGYSRTKGRRVNDPNGSNKRPERPLRNIFEDERIRAWTKSILSWMIVFIREMTAYDFPKNVELRFLKVNSLRTRVR
jgi:hypothetical protein